MNPHFIFNSLIAIQSFLFESKTDEASMFLSKYAEMMRMILENSRQEYIPLVKEVETLKRYLDLQKLRFENKFDYVIHLDPSIPKHHVLVPPMLMQPFLENALEHGLNQIKKKGLINISIAEEDESLLFEISDNGIGREKAAQLKNQRSLGHHHEPMATKITQERLEILNNSRKNKIRLNVIDLKDEAGNPLGTRIIFTIPVHYRMFNKAV